MTDEVSAASPMCVAGWECLVCGAIVDIATPLPWRCPNATDRDRHHVLSIVDRATAPRLQADTPGESGVVDEAVGDGRSRVDGVPAGAPDSGNPFIVHDERFAWSAYAAAHGIDAAGRRALVEQLDVVVRRVAGVGFTSTPFARSDSLSAALGFVDGGGIWVKDEIHGVGGSQKARHLFTILLHLLAAERLGHLTDRPPLAIASCGNAALAAATLARAAEWPIDVYVPTWMSDGFGSELDRLGARIHRCARRDDDPAGDPAMFRFREAVAAGAVPFTVQGPENALALDGGRTIGWEICEQLAATGAEQLDRVFVQVGGGAFAACLGRAISEQCPGTRLQTVQTAGCAPLARAWDRAGSDIEAGVREVASHWAELMTPWDDPQSVADGILDDETYDWLGVLQAIGPLGDAPIVAAETDVVLAHRLARDAGFDVSPTGSAGLAGLLAVIDSVRPTERVAVVMSGIAR